MEIILAHLVGDYLFQNNYMALNKHKYNLKGWFTCTLHCIIYSIIVCLMLNIFNIKGLIFIFFSHFILDKFGIVEWYLKIIKGRSIDRFLKEERNYLSNMDLIQAGFTTLVYVVVDNTMHLLIMYYGLKFFF